MAHFRPLVKRFPPVRRLHWKKKKLLTVLANRRQWATDDYPPFSGPYEIEMEHIADSWLITEASSSSPIYIITE